MSDYAYDASAQELYLSAGTPRSRLNTLESAVTNKANKVDLTNISITGSTNNTGSTISSGTFFYKDGDLVRAKTSIANGATLTLNTNYELVTAGALNDLNASFTKNKFDTRVSIVGYTSTLYEAPSDGYVSAYGGYDPSKKGSYGIYGEDATSTNDTHVSQVVYGLTSSCTFIRKGMKVLYSPGDLDSYKNLYFIPLK